VDRWIGVAVGTAEQERPISLAGLGELQRDVHGREGAGRMPVM